MSDVNVKKVMHSLLFDLSDDEVVALLVSTANGRLLGSELFRELLKEYKHLA